jgi:uncharacterized membrane protein YraQ (UPF0718 family)
MYIDLGPFAFEIEPSTIAGAALWALGLYLSLSSLAGKLTDRLSTWMNGADRSLYATQEEYEKTRTAREAQNVFYSSLLSVLPFLILGTLLSIGVEVGLGEDWVVSGGIFLTLFAGVYELERRRQEEEDAEDEEDE